MNKEYEDNSELLMILIDINARSWELPEKVTDPNEENEAQKTFLEFLSNFFAFMNTYVNYSNTNQISIMLYGQGPAEIIFPKEKQDPKNLLTNSKKTEPIKRIVLKKMTDKMKRPFEYNSSLEQALSLGMCFMNKYIHFSKYQRFLIFNKTANPIHDTLSFINTIACAKDRWPIDICTFNSTSSDTLKHIAYLTKGKYYEKKDKADQSSLYSYLIYYFLSNIHYRDEFSYYSIITTPFELECNCHHKSVLDDKKHFVCNVCLNIYCDPNHVCTHKYKSV